MFLNQITYEDLAGRGGLADLTGDEVLSELIWIQRNNTLAHSVQVAQYSEALARFLGLPEQQVRMVQKSALLHDIGKVAISEEILDKNGKLSSEEYASIQTHCQLGYEFLKQFPDLAGHSRDVLHHHERWDGKGYPQGLGSLKIPQAARIIHLADSIDAMLRPRSYKRSLPLDWVLSELDRCRGQQFDPELTDLSIEWIKTGGILDIQTTLAA